MFTPADSPSTSNGDCDSNRSGQAEYVDKPFSLANNEGNRNENSVRYLRQEPDSSEPRSSPVSCATASSSNGLDKTWNNPDVDSTALTDGGANMNDGVNSDDIQANQAVLDVDSAHSAHPKGPPSTPSSRENSLRTCTRSKLREQRQQAFENIEGNQAPVCSRNRSKSTPSLVNAAVRGFTDDNDNGDGGE